MRWARDQPSNTTLHLSYTPCYSAAAALYCFSHLCRHPLYPHTVFHLACCTRTTAFFIRNCPSWAHTATSSSGRLLRNLPLAVRPSTRTSTKMTTSSKMVLSRFSDSVLSPWPSSSPWADLYSGMIPVGSPLVVLAAHVLWRSSSLTLLTRSDIRLYSHDRLQKSIRRPRPS